MHIQGVLSYRLLKDNSQTISFRDILYSISKNFEYFFHHMKIYLRKNSSFF